MSDENSEKGERPAVRWPVVDITGCPRGQCKSCDCLEWLEPQPWTDFDEDWWGEQPPEPRAYMVQGKNLDKRRKYDPGPQDCQRCGCPSWEHKNVITQVCWLQRRYTWWGHLERCLYRQTGGIFCPELDAYDRRKAVAREWVADGEIVSVICPTSPKRRHFHPFMYHCFYRQLHTPRELIVVETGCGQGESEYFTKGPPKDDQRVVYRYFQVPEQEPWSIGVKRNVACYLAAGSVVVHFDDDDIYTPDYLTMMVRVLQEGSGDKASEVNVHMEGYAGICAPPVAGEKPRKPHLRAKKYAAEAATLSVWHTFELTSGRISLCDPKKEPDPVRQRRWTFGYGFSFAYLWAAWRAHCFMDINLGEDTDFMESMLARGGRVALVKDFSGLCAHTHHTANFSKWESDTDPTVSLDGCASEKDALPALQVYGHRLQEIVQVPLRRSCELRPQLIGRQILLVHRELFKKYNTEAFQKTLWDAWDGGSNTLKSQRARRDHIFKSQQPTLFKYGLPPNVGGMMMLQRMWNETWPALHEAINHGDFFMEYLTNPKMQLDVSLGQGPENVDWHTWVNYLFYKYFEEKEQQKER